MTEIKDMTDREACIFTAVKFQGVSQKKKKKICGSCDNKTKKLFTVASNGIYEANSLEKPKLTVSANQQNTVRFAGKGYDIEHLFIKEQIKLGDTREHAEQLGQGIMSFLEDKYVADKDGNESIETVLYYTHDPLGKREFHEIKQPTKKEVSAFDRCVELRKNFKDNQKDAETYSSLIMYDPKPTTTTLKLRTALERNAGFFSLIELMADWHLEREKIEVAQIERDRASNKKQVTVGDLQNKSKPERITAAKHSFDNRHRLTVGDLFHKKRGENVG